jgi:hypothetical protein
MAGSARAIALIAALALCGIAVGTPAAEPVGGAVAGDITDFVRRPGDQVVVAPDGVYTAGRVDAPHPRTKAPLAGWLVLVAQTRGGVVVDLSTSELELLPGTSRVMFVGFEFVNGSIDVQGEDIAFWYTDHSFPADVWAAQASDPSRPEDGYYRAPRTIYANDHSTRGLRILGSDIHDTGTGLTASNSTSLLVRGTKMWGFSDKGLDPNDVVHPNALAAVGGNSTRLTVRDSWLIGRVMLIDAPAGDVTAGGPHRRLLFADSWVSSSPGAGFTFTSRKTTKPRGVFGQRLRVRSWGHNSGQDRVEIVDGKMYVPPKSDPTLVNFMPRRVKVVDQEIARTAPAPGTPSPADVWRAAHPYETWMQAVT